MRRCTRWALIAGLVALLPGCSAPAARQEPEPPAAEPRQVTVARTSIVSVVTLQATVVTTPTTTITAPAAGVVVGFTGNGYRFRADGRTSLVTLPDQTELQSELVEPGRAVLANFPIATVRGTGFGLRAPVDNNTLIRLYAGSLDGTQAQIKKGPGPFSCPLVNHIPTAGAPDPGSLALTCVVPADVRVFAGMEAVMAVTTGERTDVLSLPVEAVAGTAGSGKVTRRTADGWSSQPVTLGITDGVTVEITDGLAEGDVVRLPAPDLDGVGS
ncbi:efflux RND transporter periplasmic adaptor subunit [Actinoplanes xinjiangensis]|jgi:hypothetical protein|uniref:CzcB-like C-terminal circularly permuted SH3-like domain-containing protein n=1 Tax=Actinoplanes xinjiangensis TaxID=512350 RepID=A0A316FL07_9ACTN|nr:efflux RND transporter periplasmic adaptor subunit [Actinoplanes xinjiangensis]PWK48933.1 hypothetical protein BC793_105284 [Actinoplanes xinjiangensis]GIF38639.1 hypothetical protein Axi01nite_29500 [Actinoplanes xinjiangensis]